MKLISWFKGSNKANKAGQRGASLVELALSTPLLFVVVTGVISSGDLLTQHPWAAQTAYQLVDVLAGNSVEMGAIAMDQRVTQIRDERRVRFARLELDMSTPEMIDNSVFNGSSFYGQLNGKEVVGVRFRANIKTIWNTTISTPIKLDVVAPHLAKSQPISNLVTFADPTDLGMAPYDCCGIRCGELGSQCAGGPGSWTPNACYAGSTFTACSQSGFNA